MPPVLRHSAATILRALPEAVRAALSAAVVAAAGARLALVGGSVRDGALGLPLDYDLDLVLEGDAPRLARALANRLDGTLVAEHAAFGTATLSAPIGARTALIDITTARRETYAQPAALPTVTPAPLDEDLARRDFSLNALALELFEAAPGDLGARLLDPFSGMADLDAGILRVLHDASFRDDPTRILRGLRLAARLGLDWEPHTATLLRAALDDGLLERTSPERVCAELCLALAEPHPDKVLQRGDGWGITPHIFSQLRWTPALAESWQRAAIAQHGVAPASLALGLLTYELGDGEREALRLRYRLPGDAARLLREVGAIKGLRDELGGSALRNSRLDALLAPFSAEAIAVARFAEHGRVAEAIRQYVEALRPLAPLLNGRDLLALGIKPGPQVGALLAQLRAAQMDGAIMTRDDALAFASQNIQ